LEKNKLLLVAVAIICLVIGGGVVGGWFTTTTVSRADYEKLKAETVSRTDYNTLKADYDALVKLVPKNRIKAGFIYVGPIGDYGWSNAHDVGRKYVDNEFPWLETVYIENVPEADVERFIDRLIQEGCDIVFTTSFGFMDGTVAAAKKYPDNLFFHCSGYLREKNSGTYFADFYQIYYLNGLMAGVLSKTGKVGYVGAYPLPEVVRHINAFALGVREVNPEATVNVRWINAWYDPGKAKEAAEALIAEGCDTLAFTEDSPTVLQVGQDYTTKGKQIYTFSHYSPMQKFAPDSCVSGQLVHWERLYEDILTRVYLGVYNKTNLSNLDLLYMLRDSGVELGGEFGVPINPKFVPELKAKIVTDPVLGKINVYDLVITRLKQMSEPITTFDPFTGPIKDQAGTVRIPQGRQATYQELWTIDWFVEGIVGSIPKA